MTDTTTVFAGEKLAPVLTDASSVAVLSDLHLGAAECVLDPGGDDHLSRFAAFLEAQHVDVDVAILNGDVCDFALATIKGTVDATRRFVAIVKQHCKRIAYVPGNHDHHSWLLANELHEFLLPLPTVDPDCVQRTERMYRTTFLNRIVDTNDREIHIAYPNLYWTPPALPDQRYVFHHGHFCEDLYEVVSDTLTAAFPDAARGDLEFLEAANSGWIEFIWYSLGQGGKGIGANGLTEYLYYQIEKNGPQVLEQGIERLYRARVSPLIRRMLAKFAKDEWWVTAGMAKHAANWIDRHAASIVVALLRAYGQHKVENETPSSSALRFHPLDEELARSCKRYLERCKTSPYLAGAKDVTMFFGHTHVGGVWDKPGEPRLFNDGAWIRGINNSWPEAHVLTVDAKGAVTDLYFGETDRDHSVKRYEPRT